MVFEEGALTVRVQPDRHVSDRALLFCAVRFGATLGADFFPRNSDDTVTTVDTVTGPCFQWVRG
jgi:hypothetical protein